MLVTVFGIIVFSHPSINVFDSVSMMALQLLRESYLGLSDATEMYVRPEQPQKGLSLIPMLVTELGIATLVRL